MKSFVNATVYIEGEGLKKCNLSFDENIVNIGDCACDSEMRGNESAQGRRTKRAKQRSVTDKS